MLKAINYYWRLFATGLCFVVFGLCAVVFGMIVFPIMRLVPGRAGAHRRRVRACFRVYMRAFVGLMRGVGVLSYEFEGAERLGQPGQIILANHPSLIDVLFLIAFTPQTTCIAKWPLFQSWLTRWPVTAAGYVSNMPTHDMIEQGAQALQEGENVIVFPEGTRTTPGQPMSFHRGAAAIAVRAAKVVTPVYIRCVPTTLLKNAPWYRIPDRRVHFTLRVGRDIDVAPFRVAPVPIGSRAFNEHLEKVFADELKAPTGGGSAFETETGNDAGALRTGDNAGRFN